jgi:hypothetical protein
VRVTDRSLPPLNEFPEAGASTGIFLGDYIGLAVGSDGQAHPAWADTRNPIFTQSAGDVRQLVNAGQGSDIYTRSLPGYGAATSSSGGGGSPPPPLALPIPLAAGHQAR